MKKQLLTLQQLIAVMDPELYKHLGMILFYASRIPALNTLLFAEKTESLHLFFCFRSVSSCLIQNEQPVKSNFLPFSRWVLITFKREFPFDDILRLWEVRRSARF